MSLNNYHLNNKLKFYINYEEFKLDIKQST